MMWVSVGLTAIYALTMALALYPPSYVPSKAQDLLMTEGLFAGPMIVAGVLSTLMGRVETRRVMLLFQFGYILFTFAIFYSTFTGEHDAQYQLALLFIPLLGFPGVVVAGFVAACLR